MTAIEIPKDTKYIVFNNGIRIKYIRYVGRLADGRLLVLEKDGRDNIVGIEIV